MGSKMVPFPLKFHMQRFLLPKYQLFMYNFLSKNIRELGNEWFQF